MLAYKFRSPSQIAFALDIMFNKRLYCSDWSKLNDPMEGQFAYSHDSTDEKDYSAVLDEIKLEKKRIKICSLSMTYDCHLLWAHYADGFSGMAIEVKLPERSPQVRKVTYGGVFAYVDIAKAEVAYDEARRILSSKYQEWQYEQEIRIITDTDYFTLRHPVRRIICGHRMDPSLFEALRIICAHKQITINRTGIGDEGIDADSVPPLGAAADHFQLDKP
jgi:hypothetical protein